MLKDICLRTVASRLRSTVTSVRHRTADPWDVEMLGILLHTPTVGVFASLLHQAIQKVPFGKTRKIR